MYPASSAAKPSVDHGLLDPKDPTPLEASLLTQNKELRKQLQVARDLADSLKTQRSDAQRECDKIKITAESHAKHLESANATLKKVRESVATVLGRGPEQSETACKEVAAILAIVPEKIATRDTYSELKADTLAALPEKLRVCEEPEKLIALAMDEPEHYNAVVRYLTAQGHFTFLTRFIVKLSDKKVSPEICAELENTAMMTLKSMPRELAMQGLSKMLTMFASRTKTFIDSYAEHANPAFGGHEAVLIRLIRLAAVYRAVNELYKLGSELLHEKDAQIKKRIKADGISPEHYDLLALRLGLSPDYVKKGDAKWNEETAQLENYRSALLKEVQAVEANFRFFIQLFHQYAQTVASKCVVVPTPFKDGEFTARFTSNKLNAELETLNLQLSELSSDLVIPKVEFYVDPQKEPRTEKEITDHLDKISLEFKPLHSDSAMRGTRKNPPVNPGDNKNLQPLLDKIAYYIEMRNFLVEETLPIHILLLEAQSFIETMTPVAPLTAPELSRFSKRTGKDSGELSTFDNQTSTRLNLAHEFVKKHADVWARIKAGFALNNQELDFLIATYNNNGKDPRNKTLGLVSTPNTTLPEGVKLPERKSLPEKLTP